MNLGQCQTVEAIWRSKLEFLNLNFNKVPTQGVIALDSIFTARCSVSINDKMTGL